jgi:hypothetical protein
MNERKACPGLLFQGTNLYSIGGRTDEQNKCQIEKLDTLKEEKWEIIQFKDSTKLWNPRSSPRCVALDNNQFFILGGYDSKDILLNECVCVKVSEKEFEFTNAMKLSCADSFYWSSTHIKTAHHIYIVSANRNIHIFSSETNSWGVLKKISWIPST